MNLLFLAFSVMCLAAGPSAGDGDYPNDSGPARIDVSAYPAQMRESYKLFAARCATCHTLARAVNSQFLEFSVLDQGPARSGDPEIFADPRVTLIGEDAWKGYIRRMTRRKDSPIKWSEGRKIWRFLVYDSVRRKTGSAGRAWRARRLKLLDDFKAKKPERYRELFERKGKMH